jgi:hypothetical protein
MCLVPGGSILRTNRIGRMEVKPTDLIQRSAEGASRRMAANTALVAVVRDARIGAWRTGA